MINLVIVLLASIFSLVDAERYFIVQDVVEETYGLRELRSYSSYNSRNQYRPSDYDVCIENLEQELVTQDYCDEVK